MKIAQELSNYKDTYNFPKAMMPAYALASALAKEDEQGKEELAKQLNYY